MKSLKDYVLESSIIESEDCKDCDKKDEKDSKEETKEQDEKSTVEDTHTVTFNFTDLEETDDTIKSLSGVDGISVEGKNVTVTAKKSDIDAVNDVEKIISEYVKKLQNSQKRASDEQYAQKIKSFSAKLNDLDSYIEQVKGEEE